MSRATASARRVFALIDTPPALKDGPESKVDFSDEKRKKKSPPTVIEFRNVDFSYHDGQPILNQLSFSVKKGQTIGM